MTKNNLGGGIVGCALALAAFVSSIQAQNGIEPRYERYNADRKSIEVDGNLDDWAGVNFIEPLFEASDGREGGNRIVTRLSHPRIVRNNTILAGLILQL